MCLYMVQYIGAKNVKRWLMLRKKNLKRKKIVLWLKLKLRGENDKNQSMCKVPVTQQLPNGGQYAMCRLPISGREKGEGK